MKTGLWKAMFSQPGFLVKARRLRGRGERRMKKGISGSALKWIALLTMLIDHFAAVFYSESWRAGAPLFSYRTYLFLRCVGRLAFPIYCFLLVEGYRHTRSVGRYLLRLFLFGLLSEVPFDLAFNRAPWDLGYQNVYFTLFLGLLALWLWDRATRGEPRACGLPRIALGLLCIALAAVLAHFVETDYAEWGVLTIAAMYLFRDSEWQRDLFSGCALLLSSPLEAIGFADFGLFHFYNGQRGRQPKYQYYVFYPAHLLLLVLASRLMYSV